MELFQKAKTVRIRSIKDRYLVAETDHDTVSQDRDGASNKSIWTVEMGGGENFVRFRSCYGTYLAATSSTFVPWVPGKMVVKQMLPELDQMSMTDWEPLRDGFQVRLRTRTGTYLRPNGGVPPWRNSITHDIPHRSKTIEKVLWHIDVAETLPPPTQSLSEIMTLQRSVSTSKLKFLKTPTFRKCSSTSCGFKNTKLPTKPVATLEDLL